MKGITIKKKNPSATVLKDYKMKSNDFLKLSLPILGHPGNHLWIVHKIDNIT